MELHETAIELLGLLLCGTMTEMKLRGREDRNRLQEGCQVDRRTLRPIDPFPSQFRAVTHSSMHSTQFHMQFYYQFHRNFNQFHADPFNFTLLYSVPSQFHAFS